MKDMKTLDEILKELDEAEKEFKEKCIKYDIQETSKRKKKEETNNENGQGQDN